MAGSGKRRRAFGDIEDAAAADSENGVRIRRDDRIHARLKRNEVRFRRNAGVQSGVETRGAQRFHQASLPRRFWFSEVPADQQGALPQTRGFFASVPSVAAPQAVTMRVGGGECEGTGAHSLIFREK